MSQNLMDELFRQISRLEAENERLSAAVQRIDKEKELVCKYTQFGDWQEFVRWVTMQYQAAFQAEYTDRTICTPEASVRPIHQLISTPPAHGDSMKTSEIASEGHAWSNGDITRSLIASRVTDHNLAFTFSKAKKSTQTLPSPDDLDMMECVVLENCRLRRQNTQLQRHLQVVKQSMQRLARLIPSS